MTFVSQRLLDDGLLAKVIVGGAAQELLSIMDLTTSEGDPKSAEGQKGNLQFRAAKKFLGFFDLDLTPPKDTDLPYKLTYKLAGGAPAGFRLAAALSEEGHVGKLFGLVKKLGDYAFTAAKYSKDDTTGEEWLESDGGPVALTGVDVALVIKGKAGEEAVVTLSPSLDGPDGMVRLGVEPPTVLLGGTGFGLRFPKDAIVFDDTTEAAPPERVKRDGVEVDTPADAQAWRVLSIPSLHLFLPEKLPFLGKHAVDAWLQVGKDPRPGIELSVHAKIPKQGKRPEINVLIECRDPAATGLSSFVPTLVEAAMELPLDEEQHFGEGGAQSVAFVAGKPVRVRARFSRAPKGADPKMLLTMALESQGPDGILAVKSEGGTGAKAVIAAGALITALIADKNIGDPGPGGDETGVWLHILLTAATGLSAFLKDTGGKVVLHGVELTTEGQELPVTGPLRMKLDYSVDAVVIPFKAGVLSIEMNGNQPMKVRIRDVILTVDPSKSGLEMIHLGVDKATMEIEDPGGWMVHSPGSLFDILGTRGGRGSVWLEIDLRFRLDLGPIKVSGATIRATLEEGGIKASLRGLEATLDLQPAISGRGAFQLIDRGEGNPPGFNALLAAQILPLNIAAEATVLLEERLIKLSIAVDLPGAIPLANTGLGIFGLGGVFLINGRAKAYNDPDLPPDPEPDVVSYELAWTHEKQRFLKPKRGDFGFGLEAVLGTVPDMGFTFSTRAGIFLTLPELQVHGSLIGRILGPRVSMTREEETGPGLKAKGVVIVDTTDGVTIGIEGSYDILPILKIVVPIGARFPVGRKDDPKADAADWYVYFGADGYPDQGRAIGPIRATVLPDIIGAEADAYLMFRGKGIAKFPRGGGKEAKDGFVLAFGFGFQFVLGVKPVVWAEVHARADVLMATHPLMLAGQGQVGGSLNLGPFSIGVDAGIEFFLSEQMPTWFRAKLCGHIDLFFFEVEGCVEIAVNNDPPRDMIYPTEHPLDRIEGSGGRRGQNACLIDDHYTWIADLATTPDAAPRVWPDAIPLLSLTAAPELEPSLVAKTDKYPRDPQFEHLDQYPEGKRARPIGSDLLQYTWHLERVELWEVAEGGADKLVDGKLTHSWLDGKVGSAGSQPQPAELALLTMQGDIWLDRLADGGAQQLQDPVADRATVCRQEPTAPLLGWAIGVAAGTTSRGCSLPPDPLSADPLQSQVRATTVLRCNRLPGPLDSYGAQGLPSPLRFVPPRVVRFPVGIPLHDRAFDGYLLLGRAEAPPSIDPHWTEPLEFQHQLEIDLDEPISQAIGWFVTDPDPVGALSQIDIQDDRGDDRGQTWKRGERQTLPDGSWADRYEPPAAPGVVSKLFVRWPLGLRFGILGIGGITERARLAAAARDQARRDLTTTLAGAGDKPLTGGDGGGGGKTEGTTRSILDPGKLYRIDVYVTWTGCLYEYEGDEKKEKAKQDAPVERYNPPGSDVTHPDQLPETKRRYFFRTIDVPPPAVDLVPLQGRIDHLCFLRKAHDVFDPKMLERHLLGYEPGQSEAARFRKDPIRAHYEVPHVAVLADRYKWTLTTACRRIDVPGDAGKEQELQSLKWSGLATDRYARAADRRRLAAYGATECHVPKPGATHEGRLDLAPQAWYEVYALLKSQRDGVPDGRLPGVTFRTSRWNGPSEMLAALQFRQDQTGKPTGDLEIRADASLQASTVLDSDSAFETTLEAFGLEGWPAAPEPRVSLLWRVGGVGGAPAWHCAGVLLESPEPIHRAGRFHVQELKLRMGPPGTAVHFDVVRRDGAGLRLLLATSRPFRPMIWRPPNFPIDTPPLLVLQALDVPVGTKEADGKALAGQLPVPLAPAFAQEEAE